jgi:hypothetical protein
VSLEDDELSNVPVIPILLSFAFLVILAGGIMASTDVQGMPVVVLNNTSSSIPVQENVTDYGEVLENTLVNDAGELVIPSDNSTGYSAVNIVR